MHLLVLYAEDQTLQLIITDLQIAISANIKTTVSGIYKRLMHL